jgi:hypothetical protein
MMQKILPLAAIVIAVGIFLGYVNPTYQGSIKTLQAQIKRYDNALVAAGKFSKREEELTAQRNQIPAAAIARLESFLPDSVNNVQLILDLNELAARSNIRIAGFSISDDTKKNGGASSGVQSLPLDSGKPVDSLDISINATGTYAAFRTFLSSVEHSLRPLDVTQLSVADSATGIYAYQITFRIYWLH